MSATRRPGSGPPPSRSRPASSSAVDGTVAEIPESIHFDELADTEVLDAVTQLPERQRAAVLLFYYADRPVAEAAEILGMSSSTFRVHLTRARRQLTRTLGDPL